MKPVKFEEQAYTDFIDWATTDKATFRKITTLIKDIDRNGESAGNGNPEALKYELSGYWSRRINLVDRLVYKIENEIIVIANCKGHYK